MCTSKGFEQVGQTASSSSGDKIASQASVDKEASAKKRKATVDEADEAARKALRKEIDAQFRKAKTMKDQWCSALSKSVTLVQSIDSDPLWAWAKTEKDEVVQKTEALRVFSQKSDFWVQWAEQDSQFLRRNFSNEVALDNLKAIEEGLAVVKTLDAKCKQLFNMQAARQRNQ